MELNQFRDVDIVLDKANDNIIQKQFVSAGDRDGRSLTLQVTNEGSIGEVPGLTANLLWTNHSSGLSDLSAFSVVDRLTSVFKIEYPQNMLTAGKVTAQIQLLHNGKVTHSKKFEIIVLNVAGNLKGVLQTAEYSALVTTLAKANEFETEIAEVSAQLAQTVSGEPGKKPVALAGVIRNTGSGWFYIDDAGHNRINMSAVSVQNGSIRVEHTGGAKKVGALVATPDETFGKEGMIVGASVGNTFSLIDLFLPLNVQIKGDSTFVAKSYFTPSLALTFRADKSSFTLIHPEVDALDMPMLVSPISAGASGEFAVSYSSTQVTVERRGDLAGYIYYDTASSTWKYQGDNVNDLSFTFGAGVLTVAHSAVVGNLYGLIVSERDGGYKPIVVSPLTASFQIKLKDTSGNTISIPDANCKFYFARIGAKYKMPLKPTERVVLKRGHAKVDATHVANTAGNIWIHGLMQN